MIIIYVLFFITLFLILHSYFIYPASIFIISKFSKSKHIRDGEFQPAVSVIISAFNEAAVIKKTIKTLLSCEYPFSKLEIIVGSDNSSDSTNDILKQLSEEHQNVRIKLFSVRRGKSQVLNDLVAEAKGDILIFCDANTIYKTDTIKKIVQNYSDTSIGGVSGKLILEESNQSALTGNQEARYWDIENKIKEKEGKLGFLIGANGGVYSIRKELYTAIPSSFPIMDDFFISLKILEKKKYFIYETEAVAIEEIAPDIMMEYRRRIRNNAIDISSLKALKKLLLPAYGLAAYGLWSHKIIRWFTPVLLIALFILNTLLFNVSLFFTILLLIQLIFYLCGLAGFILNKAKKNIFPFSICYYFVLMNIAMLIGIWRFISKKQSGTWQSTPRQ